jgi:hypothetical protein
MLAEQEFGRGSRVDNNNWYIPKLNLIDRTVRLCPVPVFLSSIDTDLPNVAKGLQKALSFLECVPVDERIHL